MGVEEEMRRFLTALTAVVFIMFAAPAFAASPFADVPAGHWAYDALARLAADGLVAGYPDGVFKGARPAARYEVASVVARALSRLDADKAEKSDLEMLKKLAAEFRDELEALGVKNDSLEKRTALLEDRLDGWRLRGTFMFDANFGADADKAFYNRRKDGSSTGTDFNKNWFTLVLTKQIDATTSFYARFRSGQYFLGTGRGDIGDGESQWDRIYVDAKLPCDINFRVGRFVEDYEAPKGLMWAYNDAAFIGFVRLDGFHFNKSWGKLSATAAIGRNANKEELVIGVWPNGLYNSATSAGQFMDYLFDLKWQPNEKFWLGGSGYMYIADSSSADKLNLTNKTFGIQAGYKLTPAVELKGSYYWQDLDSGYEGFAAETSPKAWRAVLDVRQELLKFTSLWCEYAQVDNSFLMFNPQNVWFGWSKTPAANNNPAICDNRPYGANGTMRIWSIGAEQQWSGKWRTFEKYARADFDEEWLDDACSWGFGVLYQYTPAIAFQLSYDNIDYGEGSSDAAKTSYRSGSDHVFKFRTTLNF